MSQPAIGDIVIGAMPIPAETRDTAKLLCVSNHPVTVAIMGAKIAEVAMPTRRPNTSWNSNSDRLKLAIVRLTESRQEPVSTIIRGPNRSVSVPQKILPKAMAKKPIVIASDMPVRDQPVATLMGIRNTGNANIAPTATQPRRAPEATITQR
jgi:hypothetical protein